MQKMERGGAKLDSRELRGTGARVPHPPKCSPVMCMDGWMELVNQFRDSNNSATDSNRNSFFSLENIHSKIFQVKRFIQIEQMKFFLWKALFKGTI